MVWDQIGNVSSRNSPDPIADSPVPPTVLSGRLEPHEPVRLTFINMLTRRRNAGRSFVVDFLVMRPVEYGAVVFLRRSARRLHIVT